MYSGGRVIDDNAKAFAVGVINSVWKITQIPLLSLFFLLKYSTESQSYLNDIF